MAKFPGITIFTGKGASPEEAFIAEFDTIDYASRRLLVCTPLRDRPR
jgi:hypothetical protein